MDNYWHKCAQISAFQDDHAVTGGDSGGEELYSWSIDTIRDTTLLTQVVSMVEVSPTRSLTASLLASSASYFLISWQKPSRFFATTVEYFPQIFHGVNFQRSKSLVGKTFAVY